MKSRIGNLNIRLKKIIVILLFFGVTNSILGIDSYVKYDSLYCWANNGLNIREQPYQNGVKLGIIPYGAKVQVLQTKLYPSHTNFSIEIKFNDKKCRHELGLLESKKYNLVGVWVKVKYDMIEGYVFDAYLSKRISPTEINKNKKQGFRGYFDNFKVIEEQYSIDTLFELGIRIQTRQKGIQQQNWFGKASNTRYVIPNFSMEEAVLILKNSIGENSYYSLIEIKKWSKLGGKYLKFAYAYTGIIEITEIKGTVIIGIYESC